jgi:hypothetical protein
MANFDIVNGILNGGNIVNREEKMNRTIDVMAANAHKKAAQRNGIAIQRGDNRGYGKGRKMGD